MRKGLLLHVIVLAVALPVAAQTWQGTLPDLTQPHDYISKRSSSYDRTGANADFRHLDPGKTLVLLDAAGPGEVEHLWMTIADRERFHLKDLVLRMYWDGEKSPSVEAPVGDFFGLGLGEYVSYQSAPLMVAPDKALNCFFPMPFEKDALITVTNEGHLPVLAYYFNIDYREYPAPLPKGTLYFHAQYRQATTNPGRPGTTINLDGKGNYVWLDARGRGAVRGRYDECD
jgi:hypothetical protein